jgi:hypothetical protein
MESDQKPKRQPSMASMIVWVLFCFGMWAWAIIGPLGLLLGTLSLAGVDFISAGATRDETVRIMGTFAGVGAVGLAFVWLRCRGYLKFGDRD